MKRIVLAGQASPANLGDQAILRGTLKLLADTLGESRVTLVTRGYSHKHVFEKLGLEVIASYPDVDGMAMEDSFSKVMALPKALAHPEHLARAVKEADYVFIAGGGYLYSYRSLCPGFTYQAHFSPVYWAKKYGKPVFFLPQSFGPVKSRVGKWMMGKALEASQKIYYREHISEAFLKKNFPRESSKMSFMPDHALYLKGSDLTGPEVSSPVRTNIVGVTLRPWSAEGADAEEYGKVLAAALSEFAVRYRSVIRIIVQVQDEKKQEGDEGISRRLEQALLKRLPEDQVEFCTARPFFELEELGRLYGGCDFLVSMRLHGALMSFVLGKPALLAGYQYKAPGILTSLDLKDLYLGDFQNVTQPILSEALEKMRQQYGDIQKRVTEAVSRARVQIEKEFRGGLL